MGEVIKEDLITQGIASGGKRDVGDAKTIEEDDAEAEEYYQKRLTILLSDSLGEDNTNDPTAFSSQVLKDGVTHFTHHFDKTILARIRAEVDLQFALAEKNRPYKDKYVKAFERNIWDAFSLRNIYQQCLPIVTSSLAKLELLQAAKPENVDSKDTTPLKKIISDVIHKNSNLDQKTVSSCDSEISIAKSAPSQSPRLLALNSNSSSNNKNNNNADSNPNSSSVMNNVSAPSNSQVNPKHKSAPPPPPSSLQNPKISSSGSSTNEISSVRLLESESPRLVSLPSSGNNNKNNSNRSGNSSNPSTDTSYNLKTSSGTPGTPRNPTSSTRNPGVSSSSSNSNNEISIVRSTETQSPRVFQTQSLNINNINPSRNNNNNNNHNNGGPGTSSDTGYSSTTSSPGQVKDVQRQNSKKLTASPKAPKKYSEKMKAEASILQRISELQKEGMWWERRLPKVYEPPRIKAHWDYLLEEMTWMASDFIHERKWKRAAAKKCAKMIEKYFHDKEQKRQRAEKDEEVRKRRTASTIAKIVQQFWSNVQTVVEFKEQIIIDNMRKKALDQKLSYLVNETEKYSEIVAQTFSEIAKNTGVENGIVVKQEIITPSSSPVKPPPPVTVDDDVEFVPPSGSESDVDDTIAEEEAKERHEAPDYKTELIDLEAENNMSYDEIVAKYSNFLQNPIVIKEEPISPEREPKFQPQLRVTRQRTLASRSQMTTRQQLATIKIKQEVISDDEESGSMDLASSMTEESDNEDDSEHYDKTALLSLLKSGSDEDIRKNTEAETNKLADLAESFQPKGYTLSSTTVVTKVPHLLTHKLREYQHIGLDWLVAMYDKKLNGILADEMGLGKTIQTIALLAYLAVDRCNWGPHLIVVPTSVMLNWEMEFKKWCPGFKILTYYGSQKERKLKRSGWTKPNAFHVCITSYKLVIQDHQSFRRKRWKYLILDEAQNIKNFKSQRWQLLLNFHTQRRLLLTGTPLQNNLMELWSLLHFLMPNVFQSHMEFKDWFSTPMSGMVEGSQEYNEDIVRRLHKVLRPFILRRMKTEVEKQLPQKYEHVIMCSLSKRQRYLYEEFMSRTRTKETLSQGSLLSVINVLMQLRKVCNHPNLFEPRPIVSPFQSDGIDCELPSCVWDLLRNMNEDSFRQYFPLFTITNPNYNYSVDDAITIGELTPLFAYNPDEERRYVVMNYQQCNDARQPPVKRVRRIINLVQNEPPDGPRLAKPLTLFVAPYPQQGDKILKDPEFRHCLRRDAGNKEAELRAMRRPLEAVGGRAIPLGESYKTVNNFSTSRTPTASSSGPGKMVVKEERPKRHPLPSFTLPKPAVKIKVEEASDSDSDCEVIVVKKRKAVVSRFNLMTRLQAMGSSVPDFVLDYIQERKLHDRKLVVNNLNKVSWMRCRVHTFLNQRLREKCRIVDALPSLRLTTRRAASRCLTLVRERPRDYSRNGYFNLGFSDIMKMIRIRQEDPTLFHNPFIMWSTTRFLNYLIPTLESKMKNMMRVLTRYVMYIPAVSAPALESRLYRPSSSSRYFGHVLQCDTVRKQFSKPTEIIHPIITRMLTQFPDPRLIQYDCGKLQTLDRLLRQLKTEGHRVLLFTQMAKVLDILEAFLNYHGHTYLRLDGATKIDQRQLLMERFNADDKIFCFILSTRSGGIGVNLTGADTVIFYDSDWNPTMDAQAQDRCHRIGQTRDVHIYRLVSEKTVEENILKKSNQKRLLGELAIEGGKFTTTYFKQNTIRELFTVNEKDDVIKRLSAWNTSDMSPALADDETISFNPSELMRSPEKKQEMQMIECALAAAEDDTDVQAAQTVHAEAEAEMAEFDETLSLDALEDGKGGLNKFEMEYQQVYHQLTDVERYALRLMEKTIDEWSKETAAQTQKDLEQQKMAWELQAQKIEPIKVKIEEDSNDAVDYSHLLTYPIPSSSSSTNQVWIAQFGSFEQEMAFVYYAPPTPPCDDGDVFYAEDTFHDFLYDKKIMTESQLPPVFVPKHPKIPPTPVSPVPKPVPGVEKTPEPVKEVTPPEVSELDGDSSPTKKSPKVGRREDPIFAPKSLFDRPSPAMAKLRRDLRLQRYSCRPTSSTPKTTLGPGSITFPIVTPNAQKTPAPPAPTDSPEWQIAEDYCLLQTIRNVMELPSSLLVVNLSQTPNWDYAQDAVNAVGVYHRTWKHCKWRYENVVAPREEGKLMFDTPSASDPTSPSAGKKKKAKTFIKITPPSPSKRNMKVSQLMSQDNNSQLRLIYCSKFDTIKTIANKRAPTTKPASVSPQVKSNKHIQAIGEMGINFDNPLQATSIAQARFDRIQLERKKLELQRQQQAAVAAVTAGAPASVAQELISSANNTQRTQAIAEIGMAMDNSLPATSMTQARFDRIQLERKKLELQRQQQQAAVAAVTVGAPSAVTQNLVSTVTNVQRSQAMPEIGMNIDNSLPATSTAQARFDRIQLERKKLELQRQQQAVVAAVTAGAPSVVTQDLVSSAATIQRSQHTTTGIVVTSAPTAQSGSQPQSSQPTLVSLSPQQLATKLITNAPGLATVVQSSPSRAATPVTVPSQKPVLVPVQYVRHNSLIQSFPLTPGAQYQMSPGTLQLTKDQIREHLLQAQAQQQAKRIQVVASGSPTNVVSSTSIVPQQIPAPVSLPPVSTIPTSNTYSIPGLSAPSLPIIGSGSTQKFSLSQPNTSVAISSPIVSPATTATVVQQGTQRQIQFSLSQPNTTVAISSPIVSPATTATVQQQGTQRQIQLVKQHTVGGKTVTRPVTEAEVAAFLKHHGIGGGTLTNPVSAQSVMPGSKGFQGSVPVQGSPTLLTVGLQNIMKVQPSAAGSVTTLVKTQSGPTSQPTAGGALVFPVHVSKLGSKGGNSSTTSTSGSNQPALGVQQLMIQRRQHQEQTQQSATQQPNPAQPPSQLPSASAASVSDFYGIILSKKHK